MVCGYAKLQCCLHYRKVVLKAKRGKKKKSKIELLHIFQVK
jgi:hypothetical protein